jgi:hypothetical protein
MLNRLAMFKKSKYAVTSSIFLPSKAQQASYIDIIVVYHQIRSSFKKRKKTILLQVMKFLENYRLMLNEWKMNYIHQSIINCQRALELQDQRTDIDCINNLDSNFF